jgi:hypothetical protein
MEERAHRLARRHVYDLVPLVVTDARRPVTTARKEAGPSMLNQRRLAPQNRRILKKKFVCDTHDVTAMA